MSIPRDSSSLAKTFIIGLMALLPVALTLAVVVWTAGLVYRYVGPGSAVGRFLVSVGLSFASTHFTAYVGGLILVIVAVYALGLACRYGLKAPLQNAVSALFRRVPLVSKVYDLAAKFVAVFDRKDDSALNSMTPVWCFFGGEGGVAVLALLPTAESIDLDGQTYLGILVPTAPVPFGGGLLFVPATWVKPASFGVEGLTSIYLSMGVSVPAVLSGARSAELSGPPQAGDHS